MNISFNPTLKNNTYSNNKSKKQNPAFGAVNPEWLAAIKESPSSALDGTIMIAHLNCKRKPQLVQDLVDTISKALNEISIRPKMKDAYQELLNELSISA